MDILEIINYLNQIGLTPFIKNQIQIHYPAIGQLRVSQLERLLDMSASASLDAIQDKLTFFDVEEQYQQEILTFISQLNQATDNNISTHYVDQRNSDLSPSNTRPIKFGEIEGIEEGHIFINRREMMPSSFHRSWARGIDGNGVQGASAIVLSGGYEDDEDHGNEIIYTGHGGGNDPITGKQNSDQSWSGAGNAGLRKSMENGLPVRVIRGYNHNSHLSPRSGYKYAGLYDVVDAWDEIGRSGFRICRFKLIKR